MLKLLATATVGLLLPLLVYSGEATARGAGHGLGAGAAPVDCPANTCNPRGGPVARDIKYCKASNCRKGGPK